MGYSISQETMDKINANKLAGRLCSGGNRYCSTRATKVVRSTAWMYKIDEGAARVSELKLCGRHAKLYHVGMRGVNFIVTRIGQLTPADLLGRGAR